MLPHGWSWASTINFTSPLHLSLLYISVSLPHIRLDPHRYFSIKIVCAYLFSRNPRKRLQPAQCTSDKHTCKITHTKRAAASFLHRQHNGTQSCPELPIQFVSLHKIGIFPVAPHSQFNKMAGWYSMWHRNWNEMAGVNGGKEATGLLTTANWFIPLHSATPFPEHGFSCYSLERPVFLGRVAV